MVGSVALAACTSTIFPELKGTDSSQLAISLVELANGLESPVYATSPVADPRLFVVEQPGRIRILRGGSLLPEPFLDITDRVSFEDERGLLGLAFDPDFRASGRFFVNYTDVDGNTRIEAYLDEDGGDRADPNSAMLFLEVEQPFPTHNGGQIEFGPDNMLYIALGDGGSSGDPHGHGQDATTLLGTILRIDVLDQVRSGRPPVPDPRGQPLRRAPDLASRDLALRFPEPVAVFVRCERRIHVHRRQGGGPLGGDQRRPHRERRGELWLERARGDRVLRYQFV